MGEGEAYFSKGMEVEVCSDDVGLRGAWFVATVLRSPSKKNKVLVEYHTLMADEKGSRPLREFVDVVNLRPIPPRELHRSFNSSDEVDAYLNDGWWEGVVITVLDNSRYSVYFRPGKEELEFEQSQLRIHREWVKGSWVPPMEEAQQSEQEQQQQAETQNADSENNQGNVKSDEVGLLPVDDAADICNEFNSKELKFVQPIPTSSMTQILLPCINPKQGQTSQGSLFLGAQHEEIFHSFPTSKEEAAPQNKTGLCQNLIKNFSNPFETLGDHIAGKGEKGPSMKETGQNLVDILSGPAEQFLPDFAQLKIGRVLDCGRDDDQTVEYLPSLANNGEKCDLSKTMATSPTTKEEEALQNKNQHCQNSIDNFSSRFEGLNGHVAKKGEENPPEKKEPSQNLTDVLSGPSEGFSNEPNFGQDKIGSVLYCERTGHQTVEDLSPLSNNEGEKCDLSKPMATSPTIKEELEALQKKTELCQTSTDNFSSPFEEFSNQLAGNGEETFEKKEPSKVLSSPSEGLSIYLVPKCGQVKIESVLKYDCSSQPVVEDLSAFSNTGEKCVSSKAMTTSPTTKEAATLKNKKDPTQYLTDNFSSPLEELSDHYAPMEEASLQKKVPSQNVGDIFPSPSKGLSNQLEPILGQEKIETVLDCNRSGHPTVEDLLTFVNYKGEKCDLSKAMSTTSSSTKVETPPAEKKEESQSLTDIFTSPLAGLSNQHSAKEGEASLPEKKGLTPNLNDIFSSPSEGWSNHLTTSFVQEKSGSVFGNESCGCHQTVENISMSPLSNQNGKQCDLSTTLVECSEKNIDVQVPPNSINIPDQQQCGQMEIERCCPDMASSEKKFCEKHVLEQNIRNERRRKRPREASHIIMEPFIPSEYQQQCRRTGKGWRCSKLASPWKRYCDRHEEEQNIRNGKRRKKPVEQNQFIMEPFLPSENLQCRRTGKGWRCSVMASTGKRYCGKHQLEQDTYNEKRRNMGRERRCLASSGTDEKSNFDNTHLEPSEHQQCDPVDMDLKSNQGETGIAVDQGHLSQAGMSAASVEAVSESDMGENKVEAYYDDFWSLFIT